MLSEVKIDPASGLVANLCAGNQAGSQDARQIVSIKLSPNRNARPAGQQPELIVLHNISLPPGRFGGRWITDLFLNQLDKTAHPYFVDIADNPVSAHVLVCRDGSITQYVPFHERAWHAGRSVYGDRENCNDFSIGIELEGDDVTPFTVAQYAALTALIRLLIETYPQLSTKRITGHSDIAPGRKTDPGPYFNWPRLMLGVTHDRDHSLGA